MKFISETARNRKKYVARKVRGHAFVVGVLISTIFLLDFGNVNTVLYLQTNNYGRKD
jgi:hypothetical protein